MKVLATLVALGLLMVALLVLRLLWRRMPEPVLSGLVFCTGVAIGLIVLSSATGWTLVSQRLQALLLWCGVAGYGILLVRFTLLSPRWLTSVAAIILFLPVFSSSIVLPLANLFNRSFPVLTVPLGNRLFSVRSVIDRSPVAPSAADLEIYYRPRWLPLVQHRAANVRFFDTQCDASAAYAVLQPNHRSVLLACPDQPSELQAPPGSYAAGAVVPLH